MAFHVNNEECSMFGLDSYRITVNQASWPHLSAADYLKRGFKEEGETGPHGLGGFWGRLLHVYCFEGRTIVSNEYDLTDDEGKDLLLRFFPSFETVLHFGRYHHIFQIFHQKMPTTIAKSGSTAVVLLAALRCTYTCEIISKGETISYAASVGCPSLETFFGHSGEDGGQVPAGSP